jgi:ribosomal-protein-alanine N-acetyltransferase
LIRDVKIVTFGRMFQPICLDDEQLIIRTIRSEDIERFTELAAEIFQILSDDETLRFIPEKRLHSISDAESWLQVAILNFQCNLNYLHFVTDKSSGRLLGVIDIVSPKRAKAHYRLKEYPYFLEFYLAKKARGRKVMTTLFPKIIKELHNRDIKTLGVVINRENHAALRVVTNAGFCFHSLFDTFQDLYQLPLKAVS